MLKYDCQSIKIVHREKKNKQEIMTDLPVSEKDASSGQLEPEAKSSSQTYL